MKPSNGRDKTSSTDAPAFRPSTVEARFGDGGIVAQGAVLSDEVFGAGEGLGSCGIEGGEKGGGQHQDRRHRGSAPSPCRSTTAAGSPSRKGLHMHHVGHVTIRRFRMVPYSIYSCSESAQMDRGVLVLQLAGQRLDGRRRILALGAIILFRV